MGVRENVQYWIVELTSDYGSRALMAKRLGVSKQAVSAWANGAASPDLELVSKISELYGVSLNDLMRHKPNNVSDSDSEYKQWLLSNQVDVPLYGSIAAGTPLSMIECDGEHPIPYDIYIMYPNAFFLRVKGESMNKILPNGCLALVDPCNDIDYDGQPYAICVNGYDATIKRVRKLENGFELVPDSTDPTFRPQVFDYGVEGTDEITVIGRVVYHVLPFDWKY